jgi:hypothetical protein
MLDQKTAIGIKLEQLCCELQDFLCEKEDFIPRSIYRKFEDHIREVQDLAIEISQLP